MRLRLKGSKVKSNAFSKRFKWLTLGWKTAGGHKRATAWNDGAQPQRFVAKRGFMTTERYIPKHAEAAAPISNTNLPGQPVDWPNIPQSNSWYGDPQHILYDAKSKLFYHWAIARYGKGFGSDWFEWTSPDLSVWQFNGIRLQRGRDNGGYTGASFMGGSVIISNGKFCPAGELMYFVSMQPCADTQGVKGGDQCVLVLLSKGFGQPIYKSYMLADNVEGGDWRDSYAFYADDGALQFGIASGSGGAAAHQGSTMIYRVRSLNKGDIELVDYVPNIGGWKSGHEVPNIIRMQDSPTGQNRWLIFYSEQSQPNAIKGGSRAYQSCKGGIYTRIGGKFALMREWTLDYGEDGYARRLCNPFSNKKAPYVVSTTMMFNWGADANPQSPLKGVVAGSGMVRFTLQPNGYIKAQRYDISRLIHYKGVEFVGGKTVGGIKFTRTGDAIIAQRAASAAWAWSNLERGFCIDSDDITIVVNNHATILTNETRGYEMIYKIP